ncbi:MAG TPA: dihydroorotate dehydrogenase electron transfer subunit [Thermofilaceae archaeon]|nr:dihydroorotate dehydrogenase electron transfer subunit [Thermofilaceae archaeon]
MYVRASVVQVRDLCEGIKEYALAVSLESRIQAGQFFMVWLPRVGEVPISVARVRGDIVKLVVARKGRVTGYIHDNVNVGSRIFVRGPLGRGFRIMGGRALLVGGGYGVAPLLHLAESLRAEGIRTTAVLGFKTRRKALLLEEFREVVDKLIIATDDGTLGFRGLAPDFAFKELNRGGYDVVYTCGKERMMVKVVTEAVRRGLEVQASLERLVKCGIGICGSCALEPLGLRVCTDGPVFDGDVLVLLEDFGRWWRDMAGRRVPLPE